MLITQFNNVNKPQSTKLHSKNKTAKSVLKLDLISITYF